MDVSISQLKNFLRVIDTGSFHAAAERAHRSRPAMSLSIKDLEQKFGQPLFERSTPPRLTPLAESCLPHVRDLVNHYDRVCELVERLTTGKTGELKIATISTVMSHWLLDLIPKFTLAYPDVSLHLLDNNSASIEKMVMDGTIDFGICRQGTNTVDLQFEPLIRDRFGLVCRRDHALARRKSVDWKSIEDLPLIATTTLHHPIDLPIAAASRSSMLYVQNMTMLLSMIEHHHNVAILAEMAVPSYVEDRLAFVPLNNPVIEREIGILSLRDRTASPPAQELQRMLRTIHRKQSMIPAS